jgi:hypothetical protein
MRSKISISQLKRTLSLGNGQPQENTYTAASAYEIQFQGSMTSQPGNMLWKAPKNPHIREPCKEKLDAPAELLFMLLYARNCSSLA